MLQLPNTQDAKNYNKDLKYNFILFLIFVCIVTFLKSLN